MEIVSISGIYFHNANCEKRNIKEALNTIVEEFSGIIRAVCRHCKRKFTLERIEKHQSACENASKKRPLFDMIKKRIPYLSETSQKITTKRNSIKLIYPNSKWQKQHLELLKNLRTGEESNHEDYIPCPYCFRKFAPMSAEKHIEICKNILNKPKPPHSVVSQRFPILKKNEQPLSIRTNSMKSLWRPYSVHKNKSFIDKKNITTILSTSVDEPSINITDFDQNLIKVPGFKQDSASFLGVPSVTCPKCLNKVLGSVADKHISDCKLLRPSATVKNLENEEKDFKHILIKLSSKKTEKRSNSTQRIEKPRIFCAKCAAPIPTKARFCMMCGTVRIPIRPSIN